MEGGNVTEIQQVLFELEEDYLGHPYFVSGNAILHAFGKSLPEMDYRQLHASHGIFVPGEFGRFPSEHSQSGYRPNLGTSLPPVERYDDLFLFRRPDHGWLLDSRPRDALNTHEIRVQGGHPAFTPRIIFGQPEDRRTTKRTTKWYIHAYLHADDPAILPVGEAQLDGLRFGGKRNYGYGDSRLKDTHIVDLDSLDYSSLKSADEHLIELLSPFVLRTGYPGTDDARIPWWWDTDTHGPLRRREERIVHQRRSHELETVDHGQVIAYTGDAPVQTALNGILRVGPHSKYGFGELRVIPFGSSIQDGKKQDSVIKKSDGSVG